MDNRSTSEEIQMKKTKYYYSSYMQQYEAGDEAYLTRSEILNFYEQTGVKLHVEIKDQREIGYTWEFVEDDKLPQFFQFVGSEEVEIKDEVIKLESFNRYKNGYNWKAPKKAMNARLRKPEKYKADTRLPINPRTGLRDGGA